MRIGKLSLRTEKADTGLKRARGLMFRKSLKGALLFVLDRETRIGAAIHSYFVFFPFDVVWLDKKRKVVDMKTVFPFTLFAAPREGAKYFIELPAGSIKRAGLTLGQKINLD